MVKVNLVDYSIDVVHLNRSQLYQIALEDDRLFALSEEGYLVCATMYDVNKMNPDENEAMPDAVEIQEVQIENLTNE